MWRGLLIFGAGIVVGAIGASYMAGVNEGHRQALEAKQEEGEENSEICASDDADALATV